jgi:D(-)-tartrate dehydratase
LLRALERERFLEPTPIQADAIPPLLGGRDLLGIAQTGPRRFDLETAIAYARMLRDYPLFWYKE